MSDELLIVGAGPAGVSAALWSRTFGIAARVIERSARPGGQLHFVHFHPQELPGIANGVGPEIAATFLAQLEATGFPVDFAAQATGIEVDGGAVAVTTAAGIRHEARALLVATGLRRRRLGVPGEVEFAGRGVSYSARLDRAEWAGKKVVVVGGGDGAFANALLLTEVDCRVVLIVRDHPRARQEFRARVASDSNIEVLVGAEVLAFAGDTWLDRVRIVHSGRPTELPAHGAVIKIGMTPNAEWCSALERDASGHVVASGCGRTSLARVWAAGDVVRPLLPSVAVAAGSAAIAMADLRADLRGA